MTNRDRYIIYTDGSCDPNPGTGGWAAIIGNGKEEVVLSGCELESTNNRMEMTAAIKALESLPKDACVEIFTDSQYLKKGIEEWMPTWIRKNWKGSNGKVANQDLWKRLLVEASKRQVSWHWLRGHIGNQKNSRADQLAKKAIRGCQQ
jgi:ribonuclease HI